MEAVRLPLRQDVAGARRGSSGRPGPRRPGTVHPVRRQAPAGRARGGLRARVRQRRLRTARYGKNLTRSPTRRTRR
eukprot:1418980-Pyramimonas_sp.AAC.1